MSCEGTSTAPSSAGASRRRWRYATRRVPPFFVRAAAPKQAAPYSRALTIFPAGCAQERIFLAFRSKSREVVTFRASLLLAGRPPARAAAAAAEACFSLF